MVCARIFTFKWSEFVVSVEANGVEDVIGLERDPEKVAVGDDECTSGDHVIAAQWRHLAVDHVHVEVGEYDVITLRLVQAPAASVSNSKVSKQFANTPCRYGNARAIRDHTVLPATQQR